MVRFIVVALAGVLASAAVAPAGAACVNSKCPDAALVEQARQKVQETCGCTRAGQKHGKYVQCVKKLVKAADLTALLPQKACRKLVTQCESNSICGKPDAVVCCEEKKNGKIKASIKASATKCKKGDACGASGGFYSTSDACAGDGTCATTTSTTVVVTTTTTTTIATCGDGVINQPSEQCDGGDFGGRTCQREGGRLTCTAECTVDSSQCPQGFILDFTVGTPGGPCGEVLDGAGGKIKDLTCGGLNIGGGGSTVAEGPTPAGTTSRFLLDNCSGTTCQIFPTFDNPPVNSPDADCTSTGCNFGTPLPIPNPAIATLTTCALNTWSSRAAGNVNLADGTMTVNIPLTSDVYLTGNLAQPCPVCSMGGTPSSPGMGTCDRGPRAGQTCVSTNPQGLTRDCPTGGANPPTLPCTSGGGNCLDGSHVGALSVDLSPLSTSKVTSSAADGRFCPMQASPGMASTPGCFSKSDCRSFSETGVAPGELAVGQVKNGVLASTFCIPSTGNGLVDSAASLPGPGAISLPGGFLVTEVQSVTTTTVAAPSTTTTTSTTVTIPTIPTTTSTSVPTTTTTTTICANQKTILDFTTGAPGGACGQTSGAGGKIKDLTCGGLNIGGGGSIVGEGPTPDGATNRFSLSCTGDSCTVGATATAPAPNSGTPDCTTTGCNFGTPLPIPNPALPSLTTCVLNTFATPASGTLNLATGIASLDVNLNSDVYLTGNLAQPCPRCSVTGSPSNPAVGTCDRGPNTDGQCTTTSATGLSRDCLTGGVGTGLPCNPGGGNCVDGSHVGPINVNLSPLTTGSATATANASGIFCPVQGQTGAGCFGSTACRSITENGTAAGAITSCEPAPVTVASTFCIAATGNGLVDASAALPGPGAVSLPGTFTVN